MTGEPGTETADSFDITFDTSDAAATPAAEVPVADATPQTETASATYDPSAETPAADPKAEVSTELLNFIPDDLKEVFANDTDLASLKTPQDLVKTLVDLKTSTKDMIKIPGEDATPEDLNAFYTKLGRPATTAEYQLDKKLPDGLEFSEDMFTGFTETAHANGMTQKQVKAAYDWYNNKSLEMSKGINERVEAMYKKSVDDGVKALKGEWGTDFEGNLKDAVAMAKQFLSPETRQYLNVTKLGNNPQMIKDFYELSKKVGGSQLRGGDAPAATTTLAELESKMEANLRAKDYTTNTTLQAENKKIAGDIAAIMAKSQA